MSRFRPRISPSGAALIPPRPAPVVPSPIPLNLSPPAGVAVASGVPVAAPQTNSIQEVGFLVLCAYFASGTLNEWALRLLHVKGYLSLVTLIALPFVWLACGATFRGLRHPIGRWWAVFLLLLLLDVPFSIWRSGSLALLMNYIPRSYMLFFFVTAFTGSFRNCRRLMYLNVAVSLTALLTCIVFGTYGEDGRWFVPGGAGFFENSNELAMQLLIGITQFVYLFSQKNVFGKAVAVLGIAGSMPYMLWTGSRGCALGAIACSAVVFYTSRNRARVVATIVVVTVIGLASAPSAIIRRITLLTSDEQAGTSSADLSAIESQLSRIELLKRSIYETIKHPLFGVGPGQFPVAVMDEAKQKGEWFQWLGTHNAYTQISSECGIPAFICYFAVIVLSLRLAFTLWRKSRNWSGGSEVNSLTIALLSGLVAYAVCSFFFHMGYSGTLPVMAGETVALYLAVKHEYQPADLA